MSDTEREHEAAILGLRVYLESELRRARAATDERSNAGDRAAYEYWRKAAASVEKQLAAIDHIRQQAAQARQLRDERDLLRACRNAEIALALKRLELGKDHGKELMREQRVLYAALIELQEYDAAHIATRQVVKESLTAADTDAARASASATGGREETP